MLFTAANHEKPLLSEQALESVPQQQSVPPAQPIAAKSITAACRPSTVNQITIHRITATNAATRATRAASTRSSVLPQQQSVPVVLEQSIASQTIMAAQISLNQGCHGMT